MTSTTPPTSTRPLWTALVVLAATLIAETAGLIAHAGGADIFTAILTAGAVGMLLALAHFAGVTGDR
ncbi:hypothetical protein EV385_5206 [Krasilnikovia cinnamomea]|uniref:Uncharacterized protein n=1 Tax=Krasilnikovia cinnamomea TaxID=349313 RepID=A0A4Q7ZRR4_9ACTN|nr:hypothetical protein [Krasilnikovia cinnamomea]RZU53293.1 hypothetical protein EV385_5206 [Krasilnikovia cinnamomea]